MVVENGVIGAGSVGINAIVEPYLFGDVDQVPNCVSASPQNDFAGVPLYTGENPIIPAEVKL